MNSLKPRAISLDKAFYNFLAWKGHWLPLIPPRVYGFHKHITKISPIFFCSFYMGIKFIFSFHLEVFLSSSCELLFFFLSNDFHPTSP